VPSVGFLTPRSSTAASRACSYKGVSIAKELRDGFSIHTTGNGAAKTLSAKVVIKIAKRIVMIQISV
jgi:hypothetical protein